MEYTTKQLPFSKPTLTKKVLGILLILIAIALLINPIYQTFFYEPGANESLMAWWETALIWGVCIVLALVSGFFGFASWAMGGGAGKIYSTDPEERIAAVNSKVHAGTLVQMAMTDPDPGVRKAAVEVLHFEEAEAAYKHTLTCDGFDCPELGERVEAEYERRFNERANTFDGFQSMDLTERLKAIDILQPSILEQYFPRDIGDAARQAILEKINDEQFRRKAARDKSLPSQTRAAAADFLSDVAEYSRHLEENDAKLREYAANWLIKHNHTDLLHAHLPREKDQKICKRIVDSLGTAQALDLLNEKPTNASASVIIAACNDQDALERIAGSKGLESWVSDKINERIGVLRRKVEADAKAKAEALEKIASRQGLESATLEEAKKLSRATDKEVLFKAIENVRAPRQIRVAATTSLAKLLPKNSISTIPGSQPAFHCPVCADVGDACMKPTGWEAMASSMERGGMIAGGAPCPKCGTSQSLSDIVSGKFDVVMVDINCPHCDNPMRGPIESWLNCECMKCGKIVIDR